VATNQRLHGMVNQSDVLALTVHPSVLSDGDHKADGKSNAKQITPGHIQNSLPVSHVLISPKKCQKSTLPPKASSERTFPLPNSSVASQQISSWSEMIYSRDKIQRKISNVFAEMVKMAIHHGKNHANGSSWVNNGDQLVLWSAVSHANQKNTDNFVLLSNQAQMKTFATIQQSKMVPVGGTGQVILSK